MRTHWGDDQSNRATLIRTPDDEPNPPLLSSGNGRFGVFLFAQHRMPQHWYWRALQPPDDGALCPPPSPREDPAGRARRARQGELVGSGWQRRPQGADGAAAGGDAPGTVAGPVASAGRSLRWGWLRRRAGMGAEGPKRGGGCMDGRGGEGGGRRRRPLLAGAEGPGVEVEEGAELRVHGGRRCRPPGQPPTPPPSGRGVC